MRKPLLDKNESNLLEAKLKSILLDTFCSEGQVYPRLYTPHSAIDLGATAILHQFGYMFERDGSYGLTEKGKKAAKEYVKNNDTSIMQLAVEIPDWMRKYDVTVGKYDQ